LSVAVLQEKRIYDLKKKNQELEKFKFVLDYKIKELKKQIEPKEKEIRQMKDQISEVRDKLNCHFIRNHLICTWLQMMLCCLFSLFTLIIVLVVLCTSTSVPKSSIKKLSLVFGVGSFLCNPQF